MATRIEVDGTATPLKDCVLENLQAAVGGYIQIVDCILDGMVIVIDEEGKLTGRAVNPIGTALYVHGAFDPIVGTVVVCKAEEVK